MIPQIIHYCWLSNDPIPDQLQEYIKTWKKFLPDYEFILWDFNRFNKNSSIWVQEAFSKKKYAFAADYIRIFAVYHYGGFYLDSDVEILKSLNNLLHLKAAICWQSENDGFEAACFGAEKGAPWLKKCLDYYKNRHFILSDGKIDIKPLPRIMEETLRKANYRIKSVFSLNEAVQSEDTNTLAILPSSFFSPKSFKTRLINVTEQTYSIHHFAASWVNPYDNQSIIGKILVFLHLPPIGEIWRFFHLPDTNIRGRLFKKRKQQNKKG